MLVQGFELLTIWPFAKRRLPRPGLKLGGFQQGGAHRGHDADAQQHPSGHRHGSRNGHAGDARGAKSERRLLQGFTTEFAGDDKLALARPVPANEVTLCSDKCSRCKSEAWQLTSTLFRIPALLLLTYPFKNPQTPRQLHPILSTWIEFKATPPAAARVAGFMASSPTRTVSRQPAVSPPRLSMESPGERRSGPFFVSSFGFTGAFGACCRLVQGTQAIDLPDALHNHAGQAKRPSN